MSLRFLRVARQRLRALFRRNDVDDELARELSFHVEQLTQEYVEGGMSERDARLAARRAIGNIPLLEEQSRDTRAVGWLHDLRQDIIYGARMLRRNPGFTVVALASLALGIGANTAILSVLDEVMRDRLPIPRDDRVVVIRTYPLDDSGQETHARIADYFAWRDENRSFDLMGAAMGHNADFSADASQPAERIGGQSISAESFAVLGVQPLLGRLFIEDDEPAAEIAPTRAIVLSHRLWQRRFLGRPDIIGQQVRLDRVNRTVIGVMPETFRYPNEQTSYWIPLRMDRSQQRNPQRFFVVTARLKDGVTIQQAQTELDAVAARLARVDPERHEGWGVRVKPVREAMFGWTRGRLYTLEAAIILVLLVACANVAGLLLARGLGTRSRDRAPIGARRRARTHRPPAADRKRAALRRWRPAWTRRRLGRHPSTRVDEPSAGRNRDWRRRDEPAHAGRDGGNDGRHGAALWHRSRTGPRAAVAARQAEGASWWQRRAPSEVEKRARRRADRRDHGAADWLRVADEELPACRIAGSAVRHCSVY